MEGRRLAGELAEHRRRPRVRVEHWRGEAVDRLVARTLRDGTLVWSRALPGARGPAPLVAAGLVVVHATDGVFAFEQTTGAPVWSAPLRRTAQAVQSATTMAAATGSGTLAVVSGAAVHLLRVDDGSETWTADVAPHAKRVEGPVIAGGALLRRRRWRAAALRGRGPAGAAVAARA